VGQQIDVIIGEEFQGGLERGWLERVVQETLSAGGIGSAVELGLVIADEGEVRRLNQSYRGVDEPTDVLAFGLHSFREEGLSSFITPPDGVLHLGEVILSYPQAAEQAKEQGPSLEREMALLIIHGVLHLLGYDHDDPGQESKMKGEEERILREIGGLRWWWGRSR
jgi:probable rRNA maturation factor